MSIKIKNIKLLLPAIISYEQDGEECSIFGYIDQAKQDIVFLKQPDYGFPFDMDELKKAFLDYGESRNPVYKSPTVPKNVFKKIDIPNFSGDTNG